MGRPRLRPDEVGAAPTPGETAAPAPAPPAQPEAAVAAPQIVGWRLEPWRVTDGGTTELLVELAQPAPDDGVAVVISAPWAGEPVATITVEPGTTTGQTTFAVPEGIAPDIYAIEARAGASVSTTHLDVVSVDTPTLVSFTVTPDAFSSIRDVTLRMEVGLDRPAPDGGVVVGVRQSAGSRVVDVSVPAGSASAFADYRLWANEWAPGEKTLTAEFAWVKRRATLHIRLF